MWLVLLIVHKASAVGHSSYENGLVTWSSPGLKLWGLPGHYMEDSCLEEFPKAWWTLPELEINLYGMKPLRLWACLLQQQNELMLMMHKFR